MDSPDQGVDRREDGGATALLSDPAITPNHYTRFQIQPIRFLVENFGPVVMLSHIIPYLMRWDAKNGVQDLKKARKFLDMMIAFVEGDRDWWKDRGDETHHG